MKSGNCVSVNGETPVSESFLEAGRTVTFLRSITVDGRMRRRVE
jgi:hypothetical protein